MVFNPLHGIKIEGFLVNVLTKPYILWPPWSSTVLVDMAQFFMEVCGFLAAWFWSFRPHMFCTAEGWCEELNCSIAGCTGKNVPSNCKNLILEAFTFFFSRKTIQNLYSCDSPTDMSLSLAPRHIRPGRETRSVSLALGRHRCSRCRHAMEASGVAGVGGYGEALL